MPHPLNADRIALAKAAGLAQLVLGDSDNEGDLVVSFNRFTVILTAMEAPSIWEPEGESATLSLTHADARALAQRILAETGGTSDAQP